MAKNLTPPVPQQPVHFILRYHKSLGERLQPKRPAWLSHRWLGGYISRCSYKAFTNSSKATVSRPT
jgi:hypothetical protein